MSPQGIINILFNWSGHGECYVCLLSNRVRETHTHTHTDALKTLNVTAQTTASVCLFSRQFQPTAMATTTNVNMREREKNLVDSVDISFLFFLCSVLVSSCVTVDFVRLCGTLLRFIDVSCLFRLWMVFFSQTPPEVDFTTCLRLSLEVIAVAVTIVCGRGGSSDDDDDDASYRSVLKASIDISANTKMLYNQNGGDSTMNDHKFKVTADLMNICIYTYSCVLNHRSKLYANRCC